MPTFVLTYQQGDLQSPLHQKYSSPKRRLARSWTAEHQHRVPVHRLRSRGLSLAQALLSPLSVAVASPSSELSWLRWLSSPFSYSSNASEHQRWGSSGLCKRLANHQIPATRKTT